MELFATCGTGLEVILGQELRDLGMQEVRPLTGGVAFKAGLEQVYAALLWSRVASRVLLIVGRVDATDSDSLYAGVRAIPWEDHIIAGATIAVSARGTNDQLRDTRYTALRAKDAICDRLRDLRGERPDVDAQHPDLRVQVNLRSRRATVYIDLSGGSLENRGYRDAARSTSSPVHETLAAAMLLAADWPGRARRGDVLVDSMCASGTLVIEAAMIAADIAPGITRSNWGFAGWSGHDEALWQEVLDMADTRAQEGSRSRVIYAGDECERELACARARAKAATVVPLIGFYVDREVMDEELARRTTGHALFASCLLDGAELPESMRPAWYAQLAAYLLASGVLDTAVMPHRGAGWQTPIWAMEPPRGVMPA